MTAAAGRSVLIVEDEGIVADDIGQILGGLGFEVSGIAASAEEAMARAADKRPDIALVDIRIKGKLDGIKTAELLQERFATPVVYLTAHADDKTVQRAARTRPYGYVLKPVKPAELKRTIEIALVRHAMDAQEAKGAELPAVETARRRELKAPSAASVRTHLEQLLLSPDFDASRRSRDFLAFIVGEALAGRGEALTQTEIATRVFQRKPDFDALLDPIVRIQAGRLRRSLERYYLLAGKRETVRIHLPKGTYLPAFESSPGEMLAAAAAPSPLADDTLEPRPSLVVIPFEAAADDQAIATRLWDVLTVEVGRYRYARVVLEPVGDGRDPGHRAAVRFELRGRVTRAGRDCVITASLVDRTTGEHVWGDEYHTSADAGRWSGTPDDIARVVAARVGSEHGLLVQSLMGEFRKRPDGGGSYGVILRAQFFFFQRDVSKLPSAIEELRRVVAQEPEISLAWLNLARLYNANYSFELARVATPVEEAIAFAQQAVRLDPTSARARSVLASTLLVSDECEAAIAEVDQALRLNPGSLVYREIMGYLRALAGDWDRGIAILRDAMARNPHHLPHVHVALWADFLRRKDYEQAYVSALDCRDSFFFWRSMMRAACLGHLGRKADAEASVADLLREKPAFEERGRVLIGMYVKPPELQERVVQGLRKAGLRLR